MRKAEEKKIQLLDTGAKLLSRQGYNGVGLKEVLAECKVPKGSFYHYFSSKEDYVAQVVEHYQANAMVLVDEYLQGSDDSALEKIRTIGKSVIHYLDASDYKAGCLLGGMAAEVAGTNEGIRMAVLKAYDQWKQRYTQLFSAAQVAGDIRDDVPAEMLADLFWNQWQGGLLRMQLEQSSDILEQSLNLILDTLYQKK